MSTHGSIRCAFKPCHCTFEAEGAVEFEGQTFCSERCVDGRGCDHAHCNCGEWPTAAPEEWTEPGRSSGVTSS
jgi:hypothetical protein